MFLFHHTWTNTKITSWKMVIRILNPMNQQWRFIINLSNQQKIYETKLFHLNDNRLTLHFDWWEILGPLVTSSCVTRFEIYTRNCHPKANIVLDMNLDYLHSVYFIKSPLYKHGNLHCNTTYLFFKINYYLINQWTFIMESVDSKYEANLQNVAGM